MAVRSAIFLALYYGTNAVYQGYIAKFYQQQGMSGTLLMVLLVSFPLFSALTQPLWGLSCDRARQKRPVLMLSIALSALLMPLFSLASSFPALLLLSGLFAAVYPVIQPMSDSIILSALQKENASYGTVRLCGCAAFALSTLLFGRVFRFDYRHFPLFVCAGLLLMLLSALLLPAAPNEQRHPPSYLSLLRLPYILPLLGLMMALQTALGYYFSYFSVYFTALPGGSAQGLGWAYFLSTISEAPFLLCGEKLFQRFGAGKLMLFSALTLCLRFVLMGLTSSLTVLYCCQLLHGCGFVVFSFSMAKYVSLTVPCALRASAQTLIAIAGFGIARVLGICGGALISRHAASLSAGFLWMGAFCGLIFMLFAPMFLRIKPLNGC